MIEILIQPSKKADKKFDAIIDGKKTVSFGSPQHSDFTKHKDPERKQRYLDRHKARENWNDPTTAGALSKHVLWNKNSLAERVRDMSRQIKNITSNLRLNQVNLMP